MPTVRTLFLHEHQHKDGFEIDGQVFVPMGRIVSKFRNSLGFSPRTTDMTPDLIVANPSQPAALTELFHADRVEALEKALDGEAETIRIQQKADHHKRMSTPVYVAKHDKLYWITSQLCYRGWSGWKIKRYIGSPDWKPLYGPGYYAVERVEKAELERAQTSGRRPRHRTAESQPITSCK